METSVRILRKLWRMRRVVAVFAVIAVGLGALVAYHPSFPPQSRKYEVGTAATRILIDTPASQVVAVAPKASGDLGVRASLLANLMAEGALKAEIARRAGLPPNRLVTIAPATSDAVPATKPAAARGPKANVLTLNTLTNDSGEQLPIIDVLAQAPDPRRAVVLANAAVSGLTDYLSSTASVDKVAARHQVRVRALGTAQGRTETRGPSGTIAFLVALFVFGMLCGLLLLAAAVARSWRAAASDEEEELLDPEDDAWSWEEPVGTAPLGEVPAPDDPLGEDAELHAAG
jgi:hypothetical protein